MKIAFVVKLTKAQEKIIDEKFLEGGINPNAYWIVSQPVLGNKIIKFILSDNMEQYEILNRAFKLKEKP